MGAADTAAPRYRAADLDAFAIALLRAEGMAADKAASVAASLVGADAMGHATHGLALLPWYLDAIAAGAIALDGEPEVVNDRGACVTWNGRRLPGAWLIDRATDLAIERVATHGVVTVVIGDSQHTGALAVYLPKLTDRGLLVTLACSAPAGTSVAPFGGRKGVLTPNPIAAGIPTDADPILLDVSASITTINNARQLVRTGGRLGGLWALDADGVPTDDPGCVVSGTGSLLPIGGLDHGHKGYALALLVDALTQGLAGRGRVDRPSGSVMGVYLQVTDPAAFAGADAFVRQTGWLADACRANPPRPGVERVRLPGEHAVRGRRDAPVHGIPVAASITDALAPHAQRRALALPDPIG